MQQQPSSAGQPSGTLHAALAASVWELEEAVEVPHALFKGRVVDYGCAALQQGDEDDEDDMAALLAHPPRACKSASDSCRAVNTGASGRPSGSSDDSDQEPLPVPVAAMPLPSMQVRAVTQPFCSM